MQGVVGQGSRGASPECKAHPARPSHRAQGALPVDPRSRRPRLVHPDLGPPVLLECRSRPAEGSRNTPTSAGEASLGSVAPCPRTSTARSLNEGAKVGPAPMREAYPTVHGRYPWVRNSLPPCVRHIPLLWAKRSASRQPTPLRGAYPMAGERGEARPSVGPLA